MLHNSHGQHQQTPPPKTTAAARKCPRCDSWNTKFCYYNNYSLSQPRYYCKACRRYWTHGGRQRNIPIGGVCRKTKRRRAPASASGLSLSTNGNQPLSALPALPAQNGTAVINREMGNLFCGGGGAFLSSQSVTGIHFREGKSGGDENGIDKAVPPLMRYQESRESLPQNGVSPSPKGWIPREQLMSYSWSARHEAQ